MNFISLSDTLQGINRDDLPEAAGALHQALHNFSGNRPRWAEINKSSGRPLFNDAVATEGMEILLHAAGSERKHREYVVEQMIAYQQAGIDCGDIDMGRDMNNLLYPRTKFTRPLSIGFNRTELIAFLNKNCIQHALTADVTTHPKTPTVIVWNDWLNRGELTLDDCLLLAMGENPSNPDTDTELWDMLCGDKYREWRAEAEQWIVGAGRKLTNRTG